VGHKIHIFFSRYSPTHIVVTLQIFRAQVESCASRNLCTYGQMHVCIQGSTIDIQTTTEWNLIGRNPTAPTACLNRPALLFHHLCLTALLFPQG